MAKVTILGISALAVFVVSVVGVSGASAAEGTFVTTGSTAYTATQVGTGETLTLPGGRTLSCAQITSAGTIANGAKSLTGVPTWHLCHATVGASTLAATVIPTECDYTLYDFTTTAANTYAAKTDIVCLKEKSIHIILYSSTTTHAENKPLCEYTIDPQTGLTGVHITDNANNTLNIRWTEVAIHLTRNTLIGTIGNCGAATSFSKLNGETLMTPVSGTIDLDD